MTWAEVVLSGGMLAALGLFVWVDAAYTDLARENRRLRAELRARGRR